MTVAELDTTHPFIPPPLHPSIHPSNTVLDRPLSPGALPRTVEYSREQNLAGPWHEGACALRTKCCDFLNFLGYGQVKQVLWSTYPLKESYRKGEQKMYVRTLFRPFFVTPKNASFSSFFHGNRPMIWTDKECILFWASEKLRPHDEWFGSNNAAEASQPPPT